MPLSSPSCECRLERARRVFGNARHRVAERALCASPSCLGADSVSQLATIPRRPALLRPSSMRKNIASTPISARKTTVTNVIIIPSLRPLFFSAITRQE